MPKIIERKENEIKCQSCGSRIGYTQSEVYLKNYTKESWGSRWTGAVALYASEYIYCPVCENKIKIVPDYFIGWVDDEK